MNESPLSDTRQKKLSLSMLADAFHISIRRFPVTSVMILVTTLWLLYYIEFPLVSKNVEIAMNFVLPMSCLLSLSVSIWCRVFSYSRAKEATAQIIAGIATLCDMIYLLMFGGEMSATGWVGHMAAVAAGITAILFIPSKGRISERVSWMFTNLQLANIFTTACISLCLLIAIMIIGLTIDTLIFNLSYKTYAEIDVILCFMLCSYIMLSRIPSKDECENRSESYEPSGFRIGLTKYLVLPVTLVYMAILYIYGLKILFLWELPNGIICWSVSGLALVVIFVLFLLEALRKKGTDSYTLLSCRMLPWLMLPLLVMMSVAIGYRINQYGITPARLYVAAFNLWCYSAFVYLGCRRNSWRLNKVAISFAVIFLITSIIPGANFTSISNRYMQNAVKRQLISAGIKTFPADRETFAKAYESLDRKSKRDIYEKLNYLDSWNNHDLISDIIAFPVHDNESYYYIDPIFQPYMSDHRNTDIDYLYRFQQMDQYHKIPDGCSKVRNINKSFYDCTIKDRTITMTDDHDTIILNIKHLEKLKNDTCVTISMPGDSLILIPDYININVGTEDGNEKVNYCHINGYLFKK